jgi:hypothetical protein
MMHHGDVSPEIAQGVLALKKRIAAAKTPLSQLDETINVAVWNLREFGTVRRTAAAIHFIVEILGQFDLVALVELRRPHVWMPVVGPVAPALTVGHHQHDVRRLGSRNAHAGQGDREERQHTAFQLAAHELAFFLFLPAALLAFSAGASGALGSDCSACGTEKSHGASHLHGD